MCPPVRRLAGQDKPTTVLVELTPPQSKDAGLGPSCGAYCLVIDVSYSMSHEAQITSDDGEKLGFGWSLLDIAKHATSTLISTLTAADYVTIVTYSSAVKVVQEWIKCDDRGKMAALAAVTAMKPEVETNLAKGLRQAYEQMAKVPIKSQNLYPYNLQMIVLTDGRPTPEYHPGEGTAWRSFGDAVLPRDVDCSVAIRGAYTQLLNEGQAALTAKVGALGRTMVTTIGLGNELDSPLLAHMSDSFLHIPDPGSVGAFMVNLIAQLRSTARLPDPTEGGSAADVTLLITPASAVKAVPGYASVQLGLGPPSSQLVAVAGETEATDSLAVPLGTVAMDQPRHILIELNDATFPALEVKAMLHGRVLGVASLASAAPVKPEVLETHKLRLAAVTALEAVAAANGSPEPLQRLLEAIEASPVAQLEPVKALAATIGTEAVLGCQRDNYAKWGRHYVRTLPMVLRAERRSNFRDAATQGFGKDAQGRDALFEQMSNDAELIFATMPAPTPSIKKAGGAAPGATRAQGDANTLPAEFLRAGGCLAPECVVEAVDADAEYDEEEEEGPGAGGRGATRPLRVEGVRPGMLLRTARGGVARVRCVVRTACPGNRAQLVRLPGGASLTAWHPVLLKGAAGAGGAGGEGWAFPAEVGTPSVRPCAHVYNFVLEGADRVLRVNGVGCVTLGHGLEGAVVGHAYYGTAAVLRDLQRRPGWEHGYVALQEPLLPPTNA